MKLFLCITVGYILGTLSPTALIAHLRGVDVRSRGTGNLGATNAMLNFGKAVGAFVMLFDIAKAYFACSLANLVFPSVPHAGLLAGGAAVAGHIFPFYLRFRGGKGFASFGGLVLAHDPELFVFLLGLGVTLMLITNISITLQLSSLILFPILIGIRSGSLAQAAICAAVSALILLRHRTNISDTLQKKAPSVREFIRKNFS